MDQHAWVCAVLEKRWGVGGFAHVGQVLTDSSADFEPHCLQWWHTRGSHWAILELWISKQQLNFHLYFLRMQLRARVVHGWHLLDEWYALQINNDNFLLDVEVLCQPLMAGVGWSVLLPFCSNPTQAFLNPNSCLVSLNVSFHCGSLTCSPILDVNI